MALHIDVFSDVICPWCYTGKRRLEKAIAAVDQQSDVRVKRLPFQLNPADSKRRSPPSGISRSLAVGNARTNSTPRCLRSAKPKESTGSQLIVAIKRIRYRERSQEGAEDPLHFQAVLSGLPILHGD